MNKAFICVLLIAGAAFASNFDDPIGSTTFSSEVPVPTSKVTATSFNQLDSDLLSFSASGHPSSSTWTVDTQFNSETINTEEIDKDIEDFETEDDVEGQAAEEEGQAEEEVQKSPTDGVYDPDTFDLEAISTSIDMFSILPSNSTTSFLEGLTISIVKHASGAVKVYGDVKQTAKDLQKSLQEFKKCDWHNGTSIKITLLDVVKDILDVWKTIEDTCDLIPDMKASLEEFLEANPEFEIAIEGLTVIYNIATKGATVAHNLSNDMSDLAHGLEKADWKKAMSALGGVIHDINEIRKMGEFSMSSDVSNSNKASDAQSEAKSGAPASASASGQNEWFLL